MEKGPVSALNAADADADVRLEFGLARAEFAQRSASIAAAELLAGIHETLTEAREHPELYVSAGFRGADAVTFAERSAAADLAVRLRMSEGAVQLQAEQARALIGWLPGLWAGLCEGEVAAVNARHAADLASTLPEGPVRTAFDDALVRAARELNPPRFRARARRIRDELDPRPHTERHEAARELRRVEFEAVPDGMMWLSACLDAAEGQRIRARLDAAAHHLAAVPNEQRTMGQLRADVLTDLLLAEGAGAGVSTTVAVTVPVLTLLGVAELPGTLEGYGPIDPDTARRLAAGAPSFQRILTHPVTGTVLDIDRRSYRVTADIRRWLGLRDGHCTFPGCGQSLRHTDLDHRTDWHHGGPTTVTNLAHLCRHHHRLKHESKWTVTADPSGTVTWTTPTGQQHTTDPPPF